MTRTHVSLFTGIGASDLAAEHLGYTTTHCVEIDPWNRDILHARFPNAWIFDNVCMVGARELGVGMDLMSGGFPCQDLSSAGKGGGLEAARSGLWFEFLRIIGECRPKQVLIENVAVLKSRGLNIVVKGLAEKGYGCWWDCVPAIAVGAPHLRDRIWITAVPFADMPPLAHIGLRLRLGRATSSLRAGAAGHDQDGEGRHGRRTPRGRRHVAHQAGLSPLPDPDRAGRQEPRRPCAASTQQPPAERRRVRAAARLWPTATAHPRTHTPPTGASRPTASQRGRAGGGAALAHGYRPLCGRTCGPSVAKASRIMRPVLK